MKYKLEFPKTQLRKYAAKEGESIEEKMRRVTQSKEPIDNVAPLVYTEKKDGVLPQYDHRSDRFELARLAKDRITATRKAAAQKAAEIAAEAAMKAAEKGQAAMSEA